MACRCPPAAGNTLDQAKTYTTLSRVTLGVGIVSLGIGAYLYFGAKKGSPSASSKDSAKLAPYSPEGSLLGLGVQGAF